MFVSHHTLKWTRTCRSHGRHPHAHTAHFLLNRHRAELALHKRIGASLDMAVYFCDPHSPWQRGTNENTNGLLRQYFPKGTDLSVYPEDYLDAVAEELNDRPRKTLGFMKPSEKIIELLDAA